MHSKNSMIEKSREIAKLVRIQQLGTSITAVIGALSVKGMNLEISHFILLFLMGVIMNIGGQVHNDLKDLEIDKLSEELTQRPLVKGTITTKSAKIIILLNAFVFFALALIFFRDVLTISVLLVSIIFGYLYNLYSKKIPGADVFLSVSMAFFCLFGALSVSDNIQSFQDIGVLTWIIVGMVFVHVFIMDSMGGGLKDAENDRKAGAKTLAVFLGVKANKKLHIPLSFKAINMSFDISTVILVSAPFLFFDFQYSLIQISLIVLCILGMLFSSIKLLNMNFFDKKRIKFHNRNHELTSYLLVLILLVGFIGIAWALFLILFPLLWFMIFNYVFYRDRWSNPKTY